MYSFELTGQFIPEKEREIFNDFLQFYGIDDGIWRVFECMLEAKTKGTVPLLMRVYRVPVST